MLQGTRLRYEDQSLRALLCLLSSNHLSVGFLCALGKEGAVPHALCKSKLAVSHQLLDFSMVTSELFREENVCS